MATSSLLSFASSKSEPSQKPTATCGFPGVSSQANGVQGKSPQDIQPYRQINHQDQSEFLGTLPPILPGAHELSLQKRPFSTARIVGKRIEMLSSSKLLQTSKTPKHISILRMENHEFIYVQWISMVNQELKSSFSGNCQTFSSHFRQLSTKTPHKEGRQRHWESNLRESSATKMKLLGSLKPETSRIYQKNF